ARTRCSSVGTGADCAIKVSGNATAQLTNTISFFMDFSLLRRHLYCVLQFTTNQIVSSIRTRARCHPADSTTAAPARECAKHDRITLESKLLRLFLHA